MKNLIEIIDGINELCSSTDRLYTALSGSTTDSFAAKETEDIFNSYEKYINNKSEYVDNLYINNSYESSVPNIAQSSVFTEGSENIYNTYANGGDEFGYITNIDENSDIYYAYEDNVNNFVDKTSYVEENSNVIHNFKDFSKNMDNTDYSYLRNSTDSHNTSSYSDSNININMGGITQNISSANCEDVMDTLVESLMRGLTCKGAGVYEM